MVPKISIVIPTFNVNKHIGECLRSIEAQEVDPYEVIIVDGYSTDETLNIVRSSELPIRIIEQPPRGQANAVTLGLSEARGDVIHWHAADDLLLPGALRTVSEAFNGCPTRTILFSDGTAFDEDRYIRMGTYRWHRPMHLFLFTCSFMRLQSDCVYWSRDLTVHGLPLDSTMELCADEDFFLRMIVHGRARMHWSSNRLGAFRIRSGQLSASLDRGQVPEFRASTRSRIAVKEGISPTLFKLRRVRASVGWMVLSVLPYVGACAARRLGRWISCGYFRRKENTRFQQWREFLQRTAS